ncbi:H-NS histone family protein [Robbsia andropogonis]|uniref:H-NS histone family protein n=2 Tax=Robbsia andropogonis TaxID=28092 RepID=UPI00158A5C77
MAELGFPKTQKSEPKHVKVQPIYRDPETGRTWSGRGKQPQSIVDCRLSIVDCRLSIVDCRQGSWPILDLTPMITRQPERLPLTRRGTKFFYRPACLASIGMNAHAVKEISIVPVLLPLMPAEKTLHDANNYLAHHF